MSRKRQKEIESALDATNSQTDDDFVRHFLTKTSKDNQRSWAPTWQHPHTATLYSLTLSRVANTSDADLEACFSLIQETSEKDYAASSLGWKPKSKRKEMRDPLLRYILVKDSGARVCGYTSFMPTMEEGEAVIYCYEIHLKPDLRGTGLAGLLMSFLETVACNIGVTHKVMLTVFTSNIRAFEFYQRKGFTIDDISPKRRNLRNGVVKDSDYAILSKCV